MKNKLKKKKVTKVFRFYYKPSNDTFYSSNNPDIKDEEFIIKIKSNGDHYYEFPSVYITHEMLNRFLYEFHDDLNEKCSNTFSEKVALLKDKKATLKSS